VSESETNPITMEPYENHTDPQGGQGCAQEPEAKKRHFESFGDALNAAKEDACNKAKEAAPKLKSAVADAVHDMAYGGAYGAVFLGAFAAELIPGAIREGVVKGAQAGRDKARQACEKVREKVREAVTPQKEQAPAKEVVIDIDGPAPAGA
jgi:hypothetical protein